MTDDAQRTCRTGFLKSRVAARTNHRGKIGTERIVGKPAGSEAHPSVTHLTSRPFTHHRHRIPTLLASIDKGQ